MDFIEKNGELTPEEHQYFLQKLQSQLAELLVDTDETVQEMQGAEHEFPDPADRANYEFERNTALRIRDRERKLAKKVQQALDRLKAGVYNECKRCEEPIGKKRLDARPVTTLCINCKENEEQQEHIRHT